ncbi:MAG TPA: long-chain fatty acid--CoA ligase [Clostridiales bacterium]|nr:long-chain fatty acid--CoA ligase [Clostridiales bacterium]
MADYEKLWGANYPEHLKRRLEYPDVPVFKLLEQSAERFPDNPATIFMGGRLTFKQLLDKVYRFAAALAALGVKKGDRVAIMLPNCPQAVIAYYGALKAGATVVEFNPLYVEREIEYQIKDSGSKVMVALDLLMGRITKVRESAGLEKVIWTSIKDFLPFPLNILYPIKARREGQLVEVPTGPGNYKFMDLLKEHAAAPPEHEFDPSEDVACLQYTGGTTGVSKGCMLTHRNLVVNAVQVRNWMPDIEDGGERILTVLPLFHSYAMTTCMNLAALCGGTMILLPRFIIEDVLKAIDKYKPTLFPGAPTIYVAIINHPDVQKYDLKSIKACISGSAPLPVEVQKRFEELTGGRLVEGYGLSEASPVTHCNPVYGLRKVGCIGLPFPDTVSKIVDLETGEKELPIGETGELVLKGPQVMKGYWNRPDETAATLRDGWLYTGDIAKMDEDGYTYIVDRKKEMILASGYNIYPREIEEVLYEHPKVKEAAAIGVPDEYRGETVKVFIVLKEGEEATAEEIIDFCRDKLAKYKVPKLVEFREELPKTIIGKVLRRVLVEEERKKAEKAEQSAG